MAENNGTQNNGEKTFTQADVDAIVETRLQRERSKFSDYDTLKEKAAKFDKAQEDAKSELQKAQDLAADYKSKLETREKELSAVKARGKVAGETGVPEALLHGETEEACKAEAEALLKWRGDRTVPNHGVDHLLGNKTGKAGNETEAAFSALRDQLFSNK